VVPTRIRRRATRPIAVPGTRAVSQTDAVADTENSPPGSRGAEGTPWWEQGTDPDYRFSLANERTFLAWIRTALALLAAAVALEQLVPSFSVAGVRTTLAVALALFGLLAGVAAYLNWRSNEHAMRLGRPLPRTPMMLVLSVGLAGLAVLLAVALLVQAAS
jgi:putative membrane protein